MSFYAFDCLAGQRYQERWGLDFEEFAAGQRFRHRPGVTVSQQDNTDEALDTFNAAIDTLPELPRGDLSGRSPIRRTWRGVGIQSAECR